MESVAAHIHFGNKAAKQTGERLRAANEMALVKYKAHVLLFGFSFCLVVSRSALLAVSTEAFVDDLLQFTAIFKHTTVSVTNYNDTNDHQEYALLNIRCRAVRGCCVRSRSILD